MNLPAADPTQDLCAIRAEIAELKRRIERLEARLGGLAPS
jgi:ubiquinone biosynthesis protein UbiJ